MAYHIYRAYHIHFKNHSLCFGYIFGLDLLCVNDASSVSPFGLLFFWRFLVHFLLLFHFSYFSFFKFSFPFFLLEFLSLSLSFTNLFLSFSCISSFFICSLSVSSASDSAIVRICAELGIVLPSSVPPH